MADPRVMAAVETRLRGYWNDRTWVLDPNRRGETPEDGSAFISIQYPVANVQQISIGSPGDNVWREEGAFRIQIHWYAGIGWIYEDPDNNVSIDVREWLNELATLFRGKTFEGVECGAPMTPALDDRNDEGNYYILPIAVPYKFDFHA